MELCSRCGSNPAMVYIMKKDADGQKSEGLCLACAKKLGVPLPNNLPINEEMLESLTENMSELMEQLQDENSEDGQSRAPMIDFGKLFGLRNDASKGNKGEDAKKTDGASAKQTPPQSSRKSLGQFCFDLTARAREGKLDRVIGRERELDRLMQILCRRQKNNPCLIGEPGVGKTAIAEALAQRIVKGEVPYKLKNKEVHLVDMTALVAGTQFRGQFEARMKALINEVRALGNIILVIDEVHSIVGAGDAEGSMNAANILKPALSRGEIQVIGATTMKEYRKYIEKDSALERRFQPITVDESTIEDTVEILRGIKHYYEEYHGLNVPGSLLYRAVTLSERYITDRFLPDKAIDLLDEACSYLALRSPVIGRVHELSHTLDKLNRSREELESKELTPDMPDEERNSYYKKIADIQTEALKCKGALDAAREEQAAVTLTEKDLAAVLEIWTGVPQSNITELEFDRLDRLADTLKARIIGQDKAVDAVTQAIKRSRVGVSSKRKPVSFIFAGPTGVGKTELVKQLANQLFSSNETLIRFDMSEFMEKHTVSKLIGAPPGYVGYDDAGQLTEKIRRRPYSVILFDEIEKAHPDVMNILLQILDDGRVTDAQGRTVDFCNTVIVMTTNAGTGVGNGVIGFNSSEARLDDERTLRALSGFLRPEFINRVDGVITFRPLDVCDFEKIAVIMLDETVAALRDHGYKVSYTDAAVKAVAKNSYSAAYGARNMRRYLQSHIEDKVANEIIRARGENIALILIDAPDDCSDVNVICK
ncbi:MAG: ATP-dependent Clp protease ATP-binding subunit [Clostridia bacterium]|nr:ATP-dependent Clp protease ATP-binding subunit [Clostridia bacterium]